jgi:hypothetical protein
MLLPLTAALLALSDPCRAPFRVGSDDPGRALSVSGLLGLYSVPTATVLPTGDVWLGVHDADNYTPKPEVVAHDNYTVGIGLHPRLTVALRTYDGKHAVPPAVNLDRGNSAGATLLVLGERAWLPSVALTRLDVAGASNTMTASAITATRSLAGRARLTAGYGRGTSALNGVFGGVELAPCHWLRVMAEHDAVQRTVGLRVSPFPSLMAQLGVRLGVDVVDREIDGRAYGVSLGIPLGSGVPRSALDAPRTTAPRVPPPDASVAGVRTALTEAGFENLRVWDSAGVLHVQVEQRRFNRDELDGVGAALGVIGAHAPSTASAVVLTMRRVDLPVLTLRTGLDAWRQYLVDASSADAFLAQLDVVLPAGDPVGLAAPTARSRFKLDVMPVPFLEAQLFGELGVAEERWSVLPTATVQLGRGLAVSGRATVVLHTDDRFITGLGERDYDQWLVHQAVPVPRALLPAGAAGIAQVSVGRFGADRIGSKLDADVQLGDGRWSVGGEVSAFGKSFDAPRRSTVLATARWMDRQAQWSVRTHAGQYMRGELGAGLEVARRFARTEFTFGVHRTGAATTQVSLALGLPVAPRREWAPRAVRLRSPDFFEHRRVETISLPNGVLLNEGAPLASSFEVRRVYGGRDWLRPAVVRARVGVLREAALRWR